MIKAALGTRCPRNGVRTADQLTQCNTKSLVVAATPEDTLRKRQPMPIALNEAARPVAQARYAGNSVPKVSSQVDLYRVGNQIRCAFRMASSPAYASIRQQPTTCLSRRKVPRRESVAVVSSRRSQQLRGRAGYGRLLPSCGLADLDPLGEHLARLACTPQQVRDEAWIPLL